ncbi:ABC transporter substrate-binding protein [Tessaracoccus sp. MC1679]|uniref:ABC transporter substrate-binding protein n=1 Tax=Tessaracoccus sp. MC1679 TaxID=2760313 RepID=UPI001603DB13|nr:ABC transporter substrate-binding protein [Tessaracoccus sp. MC1679]MBB1516682.1 ABC transporter substrate-binding protein [Tessaracoccus sp. MC1679]
MRRILAAGLLATLAVSACSAPATTESESGSTDSSDRTHDVSGVAKVDDLAALLPAEIRDRGTLTIGAAIDYAPAEFRAEDLTTAIGYDVDLGKAIGRVLGVETEVVDGEFASLLPGIGTKYDIGISSFTVTEERTANFTMISYITVGSSFAVKSGNPDGFNPDELCGQTIGVQTGTWQEEELAAFTEACEADGNEPIEVLPYAKQSDVTTNLVGGKVAAFYADSTVASYAVALTNDQLEVVGGVRDAAPQGIVVAQDDAELTAAIQGAVQHLMDDGTWGDILDSWGVTDAALETAEIHSQA